MNGEIRNYLTLCCDEVIPFEFSLKWKVKHRNSTKRK